MAEKLRIILRSIKKSITSHKLSLALLTLVMITAIASLITVSNRVIASQARYILKPGEIRHTRVGLVLGAGVNKDGKPFRELQARLDSAADAINEGHVDKLVLSGDNRFDHYNEPDAMIKYLKEVKKVENSKLQADYAGRSTYESCERAAKIFNLKEITIFSAESHLPRAIYLCRHFGIDAYGISSQVEANNSRRRELLARVKAVYNVYVRSENTVLGQPIDI